MQKAAMETTISGDLESFRLNHERSGFYRVVYNKEHVARLAKRIEEGNLSPLDRLGLLGDAFESAKAGYSPTTDALELLSSYKAEDNSVVWDIIVANISAIRSVMNDDELREAMKPYTRNLVRTQLDRLGWKKQDTDSHFDKLLRPLIIGMAAIADDEAVVTEALRQFEAMAKPEDVEPDLRGIIYTTAARLSHEKTFEKLLGLYNETTSSEERVTLAMALTDFRQPELVDRALSLVTTDAVRLQDVMYWIAYSFGNRYARTKTWDWLVANWDWIAKN